MCFQYSLYSTSQQLLFAIGMVYLQMMFDFSSFVISFFRLHRTDWNDYVGLRATPIPNYFNNIAVMVLWFVCWFLSLISFPLMSWVDILWWSQLDSQSFGKIIIKYVSSLCTSAVLLRVLTLFNKVCKQSILWALGLLLL